VIRSRCAVSLPPVGFFFILAFLAVSVDVYSRGKAEQKPAEDLETELTGYLSVKGNEPFSEYILTVTSDDEGYRYYRFDEPSLPLVREYQTRIIRVRCRVLKEDSGPGQPGLLSVLETWLLD